MSSASSVNPNLTGIGIVSAVLRFMINMPVIKPDIVFITLASFKLLPFLLSFAILTLGSKCKMQQDNDAQSKYEPIIREIIELERSYFFEKRNVKTERQRKLRDIIERHTNTKGDVDDS